MEQTWNESLQEKLIATFGDPKGQSLAKKYTRAFTTSYADDNSVEMAIDDIHHMETLSADQPIAVNFYFSTENPAYPLHLRLFQWQAPIPLSDVLPMLENLDLRAYNERPHKLAIDESSCIWVSDFSVTYSKPDLDIEPVKKLLQEAFTHIYFGAAESDGFNKLILGASLSWREVVILRMYAKYLHQINFIFSQSYIVKALVNNAAITKQLVELFECIHDPAKQKHAKDEAAAIEQQILDALEKVTSLDEDRIIRRLLDLIKATLRTNYFQRTADDMPKDNLAVKLNSRAIPELPLPMPLYEIFVYSPRFEAIHLRNEKVSRGGLRWSDRHEDFRTEVLGLMKAQKVKNSVIVPSGAKGGFVLKKSPKNASRDIVQAEVIYCYKSFIRGLLDLTDNIKNKVSIRPENVVCLDDMDPYLVVAADKGTATFSDIANGVSKEYDFWLGDAFASGGSAGYDHKKMGITARGAWESVKRHFRELDINIKQHDFTVVGVGDMSGDVFGNGMLYTNHIKLVAAFDHRHIFIDPNPEPIASFAERERLFKLPTSSWEDYNPNLISKGGGVFSRSLKFIPITQEMKTALDIEEDKLTPTELIRSILRAPVDLLFNGGIGTYVKATTEHNSEVGDRANDYTRINGDQLRCKVVGEGGNLGFTQLGRIEYALLGGLINTDFIDNAAGVDCSDHEVNLKILLGDEIQQGRLPAEDRNPLLASLTDEVGHLVLNDNYQQALIMSFSAYHAKKNIGLHQNYIKELEDIGLLDRRVEFIPDEKHLLERKAAGLGLTRPELAVLLAYTKILMKKEILNSDLPEEKFFSELVVTAFPQAIRKKYDDAMHHHKLHREIIATQLGNQIVNQMGITFVYRMQMESGASVPDIIRAYAVAAHTFGTTDLQNLIESLDFKIAMPLQYDMLFNIRNLLSLSVRWFLHGNHLKNNLEDVIKHYSGKVRELEGIIPTLMAGRTREYLDKLTNEFINAGLSKEIALRVATYRAIYTTLNIILVSTEHKLDLIKAAKVYFAAGERINLLWFRDQIAQDTREGHWNSLARLTLRDELDISQRALTAAIMRGDQKEPDITKLIDLWVNKNKNSIARWDKLLGMLHATNSVDYTMFFIAMRELLGLILSSQ